MLTVVSIVHPTAVSGMNEALAAAAAAAGEFGVHIVLPADRPAGPDAGPHIRTLPLSGGRRRLARYRGLRQLLRELQPDVLHVHADPCSLLTLQVATLRRRHHAASALVVECDHAVARTPFWPFSSVRRRVLAAAGAAIARHATGLRQLALAGFDGSGFIIAPPVQTHPTPAQREGAGLTVGYAAPLEAEFGVIDVLEGVAACRLPVTLLIQGSGPLRAEIQDRAASLDVAARVHFLDASAGPDGVDAATLARIDALIVMPHVKHATAAAFDRTIAAAQCHGVPVIAPDLAGLGEMVGGGGWLVEPGDPARLAGLLHHIASFPTELAGVTATTRREAANRYSDATIRDGLRRAFEAAWSQRAACASRSSDLASAAAQFRGGDL